MIQRGPFRRATGLTLSCARPPRQEIPNDFAWIFAGGTPPNAFLKKIGVGFGARDLTLEASREPRAPQRSESNSPRQQLLALAESISTGCADLKMALLGRSVSSSQVARAYSAEVG